MADGAAGDATEDSPGGPPSGATGETVGAVWTAAQWNDAYDDVPLDLELTPDPRLVALLGDRPPGHGLELGCGEGRPSVWLASLGWAMTAVDFSRVAVQRGRLLAGAQEVTVDWRWADVTTTRLALDEPLDLVLACHLHLPPAQLLPALAHACSMLAPGGSLVMIGRDRANAERDTGGPRPAELLHEADALAAALPDLTVAHRAQHEVDDPAGSGDGADRAVDLVLCATRT